MPTFLPAILDAIISSNTVTFSTHLEDTLQKPHNRSNSHSKPDIKPPFQDHPQPNTPFQDHLIAPLQDHKQPVAPFQDHKVQIVAPIQDHLTTADVRDIIALKHAFPASFANTGNMQGESTIHLDPSIPPVQHPHRKVPIEAREEIEKALQQMVDKGIIALLTEPTEWVSSLTYPRKSDDTICPCLDPCNLNTAIIIREHYKAPPRQNIPWLCGVTMFSKLDAKDGFWSIHLDTPLSYLITFNTHKGCYLYLCIPFEIMMYQGVFQMYMDQITNRLPAITAIHDDICLYGKTREEHETHFLQIMKTVSKNGLVFNSQRCSFKQPQITFHGAIFTPQGMNHTQQKSKP